MFVRQWHKKVMISYGEVSFFINDSAKDLVQDIKPNQSKFKMNDTY